MEQTCNQKRSFASFFADAEDSLGRLSKSSRRAARTIFATLDRVINQDDADDDANAASNDGISADAGPIVPDIVSCEKSNMPSTDKKRNKKSIVIAASDVSAIVGKNRYKSQTNVLDIMWQRYAPETKTFFTSSEAALNIICSEKSGRALRTLNEAISLAATAGSSSVLQSVIEKATSDIKRNENLSVAEKQLTVEFLKSKTSTTFGTKAEKRTADIEQDMVSEMGIAVVEVDESFSMYLLETDYHIYYLVGRIDRLEFCPDGKVILVEIKNRVNRLFRRVPVYEYVQVQVYLKLLNLTEAKLIEQYNGETMKMDITYDDYFFESEILPGVLEFAMSFDRILTDPVYRSKYVSTKDDCLI